MAKLTTVIGHENNNVIPAHSMGGRLICMGREGEHITQKLTFEVSVWLEDMPDAWVDIHVSPPDGEGYLVPLDAHDGKAVWTITEDDLEQAGYGSIELIATDPTTGERKKSSTARTIIHESQSHKEPEDMPPRHVPWWQKVLAAIAGVVRSVNGVLPDEDGNVKIETGTKGAVTSVNGVKPDEDGNVQIEVGGGGLPSGGAPHQMLVTDAEGKTVWEERLAYKTAEIKEVWPEATATFSTAKYNGYQITLPYGPYPANAASYMIVVFDGIEYVVNNSDPWGNEYLYRSSNEDTGEPFVLVAGGMGTVYMLASTEGEHTYAVYQVYAVYKTLDANYMPGTVLINRATGDNAVTFLNGRASGANSFAANSGTASGDRSFAAGNGEASGVASFAAGQASKASAAFAATFGYNTRASSTYQFAQGLYNIEDAESKYLHIVGNGTSSARANAYTLDWSGNGWFAGTVEGTGVIIPSSTEGSTKRFLITVDDSGTLTATEVTD